MMGINGGQFFVSMTIPAANEKEDSMTLRGRVVKYGTVTTRT